ncbi:hypothetical protein Golomagni_05116 [Golovinomyces magnicellulatus]|nr:hypothetical protein Golomagni_05116 [Golovinomyces magnicellulatus]
MLKGCGKEVLHCLRDTIVRRGVFIPRGKDRMKLYLKLRKELHKWTPEEIQAQINHGGGFVLNYRPPLPRKIVPPISSDQEANQASDLDFQSRGLERGPRASVNKELSPKMEKDNCEDKFSDLKLDNLPEDRMEYNPHVNS